MPTDVISAHTFKQLRSFQCVDIADLISFPAVVAWGHLYYRRHWARRALWPGPRGGEWALLRWMMKGASPHWGPRDAAWPFYQRRPWRPSEWLIWVSGSCHTSPLEQPVPNLWGLNILEKMFPKANILENMSSKAERGQALGLHQLNEIFLLGSVWGPHAPPPSHQANYAVCWLKNPTETSQDASEI